MVDYRPKIFTIVAGIDTFIRPILKELTLYYDITYWPMFHPLPRNWIARKFQAFGNINYIKSRCKKPYYDHDMTFIEWGGYAAHYLTKIVDGSKPILIRIHAPPRKNKLKHFQKIDYSKITGLIFVSRSVQKRFLEVVPQARETPLFVIPHGLRRDFFTMRLDGRQTKQLVMLTRLSPEKRIDLALRIIQSLPKEYTLHIMGDGPLRGSLERFAGELEIQERVHFYGWIPNQRFPLWLVDMDLILNTSEREGFPLSLLEAMASGIIPIIRNWRGAGIFPCYTTRILSFSEKEFILQAVQKIKHFYQLEEAQVRFLRQRARDWAEGFRVEHIVEQYDHLFQMLLEAQ